MADSTAPSEPQQDGGPDIEGDKEDVDAKLLEAAKDGDVVGLVRCLKKEADIGTKNAFGCTALHIAALCGSEEVTRILLARHNLNIHAQDDDGETALYQAAASGKEKITELLLKAGADVGIQTTEGDTALHRAVSENHLQIVKLLLGKGESTTIRITREETARRVNERNGKGETALHVAAQSGKGDIVKLLLECGVDVSALNKEQKTALYQAFECEEIDVVRHLPHQDDSLKSPNTAARIGLAYATYSGELSLVQELINKLVPEDSKDMILLHWAAAGGQRKVAEFLINERGFDVSKEHGRLTPLHFASKAGKEEVTRLLLDHGADINAEDATRMTPFHWAAKEGSTKVVELLLKTKHVAIESRSEDGLTALHWAARMGKKDVVQHLLNEGANFDSKDDDKCTPLHWASIEGHAELIGILIQKGADHEARQRDGGTPLHLAAFNNRTDAIAQLLKHKVDSNARDDDDWTVLHWAAAKGRKDAMESLLKKTSAEMITAEDKKGKTSLHHACAGGCFEVVKLLLDKMDQDSIAAQDDDKDCALAAAGSSCAKDVVQLLVDREADLTSAPGPGEERSQVVMPEERIELIGEMLLMNSSCWKSSTRSAQCTMQWAARNGNQDLLNKILDVDSTLLKKRSPQDTTPLYWAVFGKQEELVKMLAERLVGDKGNMLSKEDGLKALTTAARRGYNTIAQDLLQRMSDPPDPDVETNKWTPLHWAVHYDNTDVVKEMLLNGANPEEKIDNGTSALELARKMHKELIERLFDSPLRAPRKVAPLSFPDTPEQGPELDVCEAFTANIVDFYLSEGIDTTSEQQKSVYDIVYGRGPEKIMSDHLRVWGMKQVQLRFRWIHLPANNWHWLKDLVQKIYKVKKKTDKEYSRVQNFIAENRRDGEHLGDPHCRFMNAGLRFDQMDFTSSEEASYIYANWRQQTVSKTDAQSKGPELPNQEEPEKRRKPSLQAPERQEGLSPKFSEKKNATLESSVNDYVKNSESQMSRANAAGSGPAQARVRTDGTGNEEVPGAAKTQVRGELAQGAEQKKPTPSTKAGQSTETTKKREKDRVYDTGGMTGLKGCKMAIWLPFVTSESVQGQKQWRNAIRMVKEAQRRPDPHNPDYSELKKAILSLSISEARIQLSKEKNRPRGVTSPFNSACVRALSEVEDAINNIHDKAAPAPKQLISDPMSPSGGPEKAKLDNKQECLDKAINQLKNGFKEYLSLSVFSCLESLQEAVEIYSGNLETVKETKLLQCYLGLSDEDDVKTHHLHVPRTLDQYYYSSLPDTRRRDVDQVVRRYQKDKWSRLRGDENQPDKQSQPDNQNVSLFRRILDLLRSKSSGSGGKNTGSDSASSPEKRTPDVDSQDFRMCMVDQLWLWIIDDETIITCFPDRWGQNPKKGARAETETGNGEDRLVRRISKHVSEDHKPPIRNVYHMAALITSFCTDFVDQCKVKPDGRRGSSTLESFLHVFANSIGVVMDKEVQFFEDFRLDIAARHNNTQTNRDSHSSNLELRLDNEIELLEEIKDIRDELNILRSICADQDDVLKKLFQLATVHDSEGKRDDTNDRILNYYRQRSNIDTRIARINKMQRDIGTAYDAMNHLLDLKQKDANILEAAEARKQAAATTQQGRTIMVFTIVTIFCVQLPMSFLASLYALNIQSFPHDQSDNVSYPSEWIFSRIFGTSAALAVPLIIVAFKINTVLDYFERWSRGEGSNNSNNKGNIENSGERNSNSSTPEDKKRVTEQQNHSHGRFKSYVDEVFRREKVAQESAMERGLANAGGKVSKDGARSLVEQVNPGSESSIADRERLY
ncbi:hypothetical protein AYL99_03732 [Fonsecaea erecta]|uniref:Uncharacterized protein n=1 Tax=Fonsecaea erecta TaxID=1367422 RepID=A0A178ZNZ7_9EURO|nr:hypothetical protein AYL99_03732 [Fonsecaea erecta]OAP61529.1 hypothetical protein AYL99_03732 [Fonsecaea erecta]